VGRAGVERIVGVGTVGVVGAAA
jgi:hypothetical protein